MRRTALVDGRRGQAVLLTALAAALSVGGLAASAPPPAPAPTAAPAARASAGGWTTPLALSARMSVLPQVAVDSSGDAIFTWMHFDGSNYRVQVQVRAADGTLGSIQTLSPAKVDSFFPQIAVDPAGDAVVTWVRFDGATVRVQARARAADGTLSKIQTLSPVGRNAFAPQVGVDGTGDAVFAWQGSDGANDRIQARARAADGTLSSIQALSDPGQDAVAPKVAVESDGDAVFAWIDGDGAGDRIQARVRSSDGTLTAVQTLSDPGQDAQKPQVAVDGTGDAVFAWQRSDGATVRIQARVRAADGTLSAVQTLSPSGRNAFDSRVGVGSGGDAFFAWKLFDGADDRIQARGRAADGTLGKVQTLSDAGADASAPEVAVSAAGDQVYAWQRNFHIEARTMVGGALSPVTVLGAGFQDSITEGPEAAIDSASRATVTWNQQLLGSSYIFRLPSIVASFGP